LQFRAELFGFIRAIVRNTQEAEDLFQDVAAVIVRKAGEGIEVANFRAWSKEIARRHIMAHYRKRKAHPNVNMPAEEMAELVCDTYEHDSASAAQLVEEHDALLQCLDGMPPRTRTLLKLRFWRDKSYDEIAGAVKKSEDAVRRATSRARLVLAECVRKRLGWEPGSA